MNGKLSHGFVLGERVVEPRLGLVITDGKVHHLPPRAMALLLMLAEHCGELVTREDIASELWNGSSVSYGTLTRHVSEIRRSLGDDPRHPRFVETVPQRGYRLICNVVAEDDCGEDAAHVSGNNENEKRSSLGALYSELHKRRVVRAALLYVLVVWLSLQVGEIVFPALGVPEWTLTLLLLLGVLGFPIAMVLAWVFQLTPGGLKLDIGLAKRDQKTRGYRQPIELVVIATLLIVVVVLSGQLVIQAKAAHAPGQGAAHTTEACVEPDTASLVTAER